MCLYVSYVHVMIVMKMEMMIIIILLKIFSSSQAFRIIDSQKLDVPVWSLSTINQDQQISQSSNNMNLITYAYPVSIKPKVKWAISLYKGSLTHRNFKASRWGMLQRLTTKHMNAFTILGKQSGYIINKIEALTNLGYDLTTINHSQLNGMINSADIDMITSSDSNDASVVPGSMMDSNTTGRKVMVFTDSSYVIYLKYDDNDQTIPVIDIGDHELFICDQIATFKCQYDQSTTAATTIVTTTDNAASTTEEGVHSDDDTKDVGIYKHYDYSQELTTSMLRALNMI